MSLKKFREEDKKKNQIIVFTIVCILLIAGVFLYQSYALFETKDNFNVVSGSIEKPGDLSFAFYVNDEIVLEAPSKESNLALSEKSNCNNGVTVSWNVESWNASVDYSNYKQEKTSKTKCNLFFRDAVYSDYVTSCGENGNTAVDCMKKYSDKDSINLSYDETVDNNLRYIGANPNNYIDIGDRDLDGNIILWRMIGVMENIRKSENSEGETRLKIIRDESIGAYSWDTSPSNINGGFGVSEWSQADAMKLINPGFESTSVGGSLYWNSTSGTCYAGDNNVKKACGFESSGLSSGSRLYFDEAIWHLGTYQGGNELTNNSLLARQHYNYERSNNNSKIGGCVLCNDTVTRKTRWSGYVGLLYASDYGYATSGGLVTNRETCLNTTLYEWRYSEVSDCRNNDWLFLGAANLLMNPSAFSSYLSASPVGAGSWGLFSDGNVSNKRASEAANLYPILYLKSKVQIIQGEGTSLNPYTISFFK